MGARLSIQDRPCASQHDRHRHGRNCTLSLFTMRASPGNPNVLFTNPATDGGAQNSDAIVGVVVSFDTVP